MFKWWRISMGRTNFTPSWRRIRGLGLVELMVGMVIGMVTLLVVTQVMQSFEGQKRTSSGGNDAQTNGALALYLLDREIRMAGYGVAGPEGMLCKNGINTYYDDPGGAPAITVGGAFLPIQIEDGGDGKPDAIVVMRSDAEFGAIPTSVVKDMPTPSSIITAGTSGGLAKGDLFIMASKTGDKRCTLMQMTQDPQATGNGFNLQHNPGADGPYNPSNPEKVFGEANTPKYEIGDIVINMGAYVRRRYEVDVESAQLTEEDLMAAAAATPLLSHIVDMQAVYGIAAPGSSKITQWLPATGVWAFGAVDADEVQQIRALRIAIVARSPQYEKEIVTGDTVPLWEGGPSRSFSEPERHYRYKVFETIIPLRNIIWAAS